MDHESAVRLFYQAFASRRLADAGTLLSDDFEWSDFGFSRNFKGKSGYLENMKIWLDAFPNSLSLEILELHTGRDFAAAESIASGTMSGPLRYAQTQFEPTERRMSLRHCNIFYFKGELISAVHTYYDVRALMEQLAVRITKRAA
jgi:ketosteroid isomerase-like protein